MESREISVGLIRELSVFGVTSMAFPVLGSVICSLLLGVVAGTSGICFMVSGSTIGKRLFGVDSASSPPSIRDGVCLATSEAGSSSMPHNSNGGGDRLAGELCVGDITGVSLSRRTSDAWALSKPFPTRAPSAISG